MSLQSSLQLYQRVPYVAPPWLIGAVSPQVIPSHKVSLGRFPTPLHRFEGVEELEAAGLDVWLKRDDLSSFDLSGNKVRKLEHLMAEAIEEEEVVDDATGAKTKSRKFESVITIGGIQSNHCRATACAARQLKLAPHLILRTPQDPATVGLEGNLLLDRMVGSKIYTVSPGTYAQVGSKALVAQLALQLTEQGLKPFAVPVGGSNLRGAFGYLDAVQEIVDQTKELLQLGMMNNGQFDHIVFACGSGGTATGLALGARLAGLTSQLHAVAVCDSPDYFYNHILDTAVELGVDIEAIGNPRDWLTIHAGQGIGYARSTDEEISFLRKVSANTGIVFDPVYSGKALYHYCKLVREGSVGFRKGESVLFWHTGGTLGLYEKEKQILPLLPQDQVTKMRVSPPIKL